MKNKIMIIVASVILVVIVAVICVNNFKQKEKQVAKIGEIEEKSSEEQENEYIDIEELENMQGNGEEQENQNTVNENTTNQNTGKNETSNTNRNTNNKMPYYIKVNYGAQVVTIYGKDSEGNYTVPVKAMVCSTGTATPKSGVYSIPARWEWLRLKGYVWGHYSTQITGNILFHSVPYLTKGDPASLEYWEYDKLGTYASAGCVRLMVKDAKWIFNNCANGTKVEFYSDSNPGPLGKPTAKKISSYPEPLRNWDPTDTNGSNPWLTYKPEEITKPKNEIQNNITSEAPNQNKNEIANKVKNEVTNEVTNEVKNEVVNEIKNETTNTTTNETTNTINNTSPDKENKEMMNKMDENKETVNKI